MIHVVEQGECLSSLAAQYGFSSWKDLYEHPATGCGCRFSAPTTR